MAIWCIGRNYSEHAKELGNEIPKSPVVFQKADACKNPNPEIHLPDFSNEIHHELEVYFVWDSQLQLSQFGLALDLTARDLQSEAKKQGKPWALAKSFKGSCPHTARQALPENLQQTEFRLFCNAQLRQNGKLEDCIFSLKSLDKYMQAHFPISAGDWLLTGTPAGVAALRKGDHLRAEFGDLISAEWQVL